jgi:hypothetical protein
VQAACGLPWSMRHPAPRKYLSEFAVNLYSARWLMVTPSEIMSGGSIPADASELVQRCHIYLIYDSMGYRPNEGLGFFPADTAVAPTNCNLVLLPTAATGHQRTSKPRLIISAVPSIPDVPRKCCGDLSQKRPLLLA